MSKKKLVKSLTNNMAPVLARSIGNWGVIALGLFLSTVAMVSMPFCYDVGIVMMYKLFGPGFILGIGVALVDVGVLSTMGILVDTRHTPGVDSNQKHLVCFLGGR